MAFTPVLVDKFSLTNQGHEIKRIHRSRTHVSQEQQSASYISTHTYVCKVPVREFLQLWLFQSQQHHCIADVRSAATAKIHTLV